MTIRYDEEGNAYDDGEYDYSQEASQEVIVEDVPEEVIVEDVPQTFDTNSFYDDRGIGGNPTVDNLSGNDLYSFDYSPDSTASTPVIDDPYKYEPIDSGAYNYTPDVIEDPYTPSSGTSTVSTSQFENARATPFRGGQNGTVGTPIRDRLFGRKGRYTESESEPVVSSSPVSVVDSPISIQKADALAAADMSGYDYRPASQQGPPSELMRDTVVKMPAGNPNPEVPTIFTNRLNDPARIMDYQYKMGMNDIPETTTSIDKFGREIPASGFFPIEDGASPVTAKPMERIMVSDGVIKMPEGDRNSSSPKIYTNDINDPARILGHTFEQQKLLDKQTNWSTAPTSIDKFGRAIPYKYSMLDRTPEGMAIIPKGNLFQGDSDPKYGRVYNPLTFPEMERHLIEARDNGNWTTGTTDLRNNGTVLNLESYYANMERLGFKPNEIRTVYPEGQPLPPKQTDLPQFDPKWDGSLRVTNPDGTVQGAPPASPKSVPVAAAAGTMSEAIAAPMKEVPSAPVVSDPLAPVNSVEAKAKAALGATNDEPYQLTPKEFEQKIHADLKTAMRFGTKEDQDKAASAYYKALKDGKAQPIDDPDTNKSYTESYRKLNADDLTGRFYDTPDRVEKRLIADVILEKLLEPLTEIQKEALRDGESVIRKVNYTDMGKGIGGLFQHTNFIAKEALSRKPGGVFVTTPQDVGLGGAPAAPAGVAPAGVAPAGVAPAGPSGQGIVAPRPAAKSTNSISPVEDNKLIISSTGIDGQLKTDLIKSPDQILTPGEANQAVAKISAMQAADVNKVPLPNIRKILQSQQGRAAELGEGKLNYLQNQTENWAESIKKEWSDSQTNTRSGSNNQSQGRSVGSSNSYGNSNSSGNEGGWSNSQGGGGKGAPSSSQSGGWNNKSGSTSGSESSVRNTNEQGATQGSSNSSTSQVGGGTNSTKGGSSDTIDNRGNVMSMLNANEQIQVTNMMTKYKNDLDQVSRNHAAVLAPYLVRQAALGGKDSVSDFGSLAASLFRTTSVPQNFGAAVNPTTAANVISYMQHVDTRQSSVTKAWSSAIPELYSATDKNLNPDTGVAPLSEVQFPWIKAVIDGKLGATESSKNAGIEATDFISKLNNFTSPEDLSREKLRGDKAEEGIAASIANGSTHLLKSVQTYNTAKVLNALDVLTNIATMPAGTGKTPDGKDMPKQLIPFDKFVNTVATRMFDTPNGNSHLGPVAIEFIKSVPEYKRQLDELSKNKARGMLWGQDDKTGPIYNKLQGFADWRNQDKWFTNQIKGLPVRY